MRTKWCLILVVCFSLFSDASPSSLISDGAFGSSIQIERRLLQTKNPCPMNFEFQNYTVITSHCKGPDYPPTLCCSAFKQFACPFADVLNDLSNNCASTMFSYINLYGQYPPGLFASVCREGQLGLSCAAQAPSPSSLPSSRSQNASPMSSDTRRAAAATGHLLLLMASSLLLLLHFTIIM